MHPVTKVLVVLAALLSIALAALTIAFTANAERLRGDFVNEREAAQAARDAASRDMSAHSEERNRLRSEIDSLHNQVSEMTSRLDGMQRENSRLLAELRTAESASLAVQAQLDQLSATNETLSNLIARYRDEVTSLRESGLRFAQREIGLSDRVSDLSGQLEVALENNRALQEQLVEVRDQLAAAATGETVDRDAVARPSMPIRARITDVRRGPAGDLLVQIDAGQNDMLRAMMELSIVRGDRFLGKVVLQTVDIAASVGKVDFLGLPATEIRSGDYVISVIQ